MTRRGPKNAFTRRTSVDRKLAMLGFSAVEGSHNFLALLEFDITGLRSELRTARAKGSGGSLFSFFVKAISVCLAEFPECNAMVDRRRTTSFGSVDVAVPVEMRDPEGRVYNRQVLVRNADTRELRDISAEIEGAKGIADDARGFVLSPLARKALAFLPSFLAVALIRLLMKNHLVTRQLSGTVFITSVTMFSGARGFVIPYSGGPKACSFAIGSACMKPAVVEGRVEAREMINVTAVFNHDAIDGAPAARFLDRLRSIVERERLAAFGGEAL